MAWHVYRVSMSPPCFLLLLSFLGRFGVSNAWARKAAKNVLLVFMDCGWTVFDGICCMKTAQALLFMFISIGSFFSFSFLASFLL
ncbi:hypothetical protein F4775DRAFT_562637 [Biscogniauxia sp. FL1348]|nr:hypothetical protein F4775DRAFT_562637 [Biscogniauxia sp. FL1348]